MNLVEEGEGRRHGTNGLEGRGRKKGLGRKGFRK